LVPAHLKWNNSLVRFVYFLGFTLLANASDLLPQVLQQKNLAHLADDAWAAWHIVMPSILTRGTEVRVREPYVGLCPSYRHDIRARLHSHTTDSAASRLPDKLRQVSSRMCSRLGLRVWRYVEMWRCQEIDLHLHHAEKTKVV
jgi:hypothetical protein